MILNDHKKTKSNSKKSALLLTHLLSALILQLKAKFQDESIWW